MAQPQSLLQAMALARLQEDKLNEMKQFFKSVSQNSMSEYTPNKVQSGYQPMLPKPAVPTTSFQCKTTSFPINKLTPAELKIRREKGLCYNCDDKYAPGHKCKSKFILLISNDDEQDMEFSGEGKNEEDPGDSTIISIPEVSMHALAGQINP